jgi:hypothetical protein
MRRPSFFEHPTLASQLVSTIRQEASMIKLTWLPNWKAYAVRLNGQLVGLVRCSVPPPFRMKIEFA